MSEKTPVKLYVGPDYKEPKLYTHIELMFPFWGVTAKESTPYVRAASLQYQYSKDDFTLVDNIMDSGLRGDALSLRSPKVGKSWTSTEDNHGCT